MISTIEQHLLRSTEIHEFHVTFLQQLVVLLGICHSIYPKFSESSLYSYARYGQDQRTGIVLDEERGHRLT